MSGIGIVIPSHGLILMDVGEGTFGQMTRLYGLEGAMSALKTLRFIFISHLHADHHMGTVKILLAWSQVMATHNFIFLVAPSNSPVSHRSCKIVAIFDGVRTMSAPATRQH